jgi:hypothetical protein
LVSRVSAVLGLITFMADNNDGICRLSIKRMAQIFARDERNITASITELEKAHLIGVNRVAGLPNTYYPKVPAPLTTVGASVVWFADALSDRPRARVFPVRGADLPVKPTPDVGIGGGAHQTPDVHITPDDNTRCRATGTPDVEQHSISLREMAKEGGNTPPVREPAKPKPLTQPKPATVRHERAPSFDTGQKSLSGRDQIDAALSPDAAYATRNITVEKGRVTIGEELRSDLRCDGYTDEQINLSLPRGLERAQKTTGGRDPKPLVILHSIRWALSYIKQDAPKQSTNAKRFGRGTLRQV